LFSAASLIVKKKSKQCPKKSKIFETDSAEDCFATRICRESQVNCNAERQGKQSKQMKQKTEIEIELKETVAYSRRSERFETFCPECKTLVEMAAPPVAAVLTQTTEREIYRLVETGKVHFIETDRVLICLNSFADFKKGDRKDLKNS
jgi:hypothetical protein